MTFSMTGPRYAVEHKAKGCRRWAVIATYPTAEEAWRSAFDLMGKTAGDWRVSPVSPTQPIDPDRATLKPGSFGRGSV